MMMRKACSSRVYHALMILQDVNLEEEVRSITATKSHVDLVVCIAKKHHLTIDAVNLRCADHTTDLISVSCIFDFT